MILPEQRFVVRDGAEHVCDLPLDLLVDGAPPRGAPGPRPDRPARRTYRGTAAVVDVRRGIAPLLGSPNLGSRASVYRRYDHQVGDATVILPGGDAALVRVDGTSLGLALATDGNSRYTALDARRER